MLKRPAPAVEEGFSKPRDSAYCRETFLTYLEYIGQNLRAVTPQGRVLIFRDGFTRHAASSGMLFQQHDHI